MIGIGSVASRGFLDKPYDLVTSKGSSIIDSLKSKAQEEKSKGNLAKGSSYALGAAATSFGTGVLAGVTGIVSPKAWKGILDAVKRPRETSKL